VRSPAESVLGGRIRAIGIADRRAGALWRGAAVVLFVLVAGCAPLVGQGAGETVVVRPGDSLWGVGQRSGVGWREIAAANGIGPPWTVMPGQVLRLPEASRRGAGAGAASGPVAAAGPVGVSGPVSVAGADAVPGAGAVAVASAAAGPEAGAGAGPRAVPNAERIAAAGAAGSSLGSAWTGAAQSRVRSTPLAPPAEGGSALGGARQGTAGSERDPDPALPRPPERPSEMAEPDATGAEPAEAVAADEAERLPLPPRPPAVSGAVVRAAASAPGANVQAAASAGSGVSAASRLGRGGPPSLVWPVSGRVLTPFGPTESGQVNDGINIAGRAGETVRAAASGEVVYAGNELRGFGNLVLVRHAGGWITTYAHLDRIGVARGARLAQGQALGTLGATGRVSQPQLHFQLRQENRPRDPLAFLPRSSQRG